MQLFCRARTASSRNIFLAGAEAAWIWLLFVHQEYESEPELHLFLSWRRLEMSSEILQRT
jgi:hypothetical protein